MRERISRPGDTMREGGTQKIRAEPEKGRRQGRHYDTPSGVEDIIGVLQRLWVRRSGFDGPIKSCCVR